MKVIAKFAALTLLVSLPAFSTSTPSLQEVSFNDPQYLKEKKGWTKIKRKLASEMSFQESDLSSDFKNLRDEWLKCKTGDEVEALLKKSYANYASYSEDTRYFLAQMHTALPLRGIIWRVRPLFESNRGFLGNKSTHVAAIQAVRSIVTGLKMFLPTAQTDSLIQYFTEPSVEMSKADQFKTMTEFQDYLSASMLPNLSEATTKLIAISKDSSQKVFVWDNKMAFGRATFEDGLNRFVGNGSTEIYFTIATLYRAYHNLAVFCSYNQDAMIKVAGQIGTHFGIDSSILSSKRGDLGMSDQERVEIIKEAAEKKDFLQLRNANNSGYGAHLMKQAYVALKNSVVFAERAHDFLQGRDRSSAMVINPLIFQAENSPNLAKGIKNMKPVVSGTAEVRDPVTGDTVSINLPMFYSEPPASLSVLMATKFEGGETEKTITNKKGEALKVRNYSYGRSIAWDNQGWKKYVPSAEGQKPGYMAEARRIIHYSLGTSMVFGLPDLFVH